MTDETQAKMSGDISPPEMSPPEPVPPPRRKGGWPKGRRRVAPTPREKMADEFAGATTGRGWNNDCPDACDRFHPQGLGCYITKQGSGGCGHPEKSGLQSADKNNHKVIERFSRFKTYLDHLKVDRRA